MTARVDLGRSRSPFAKFRSVSAVSSEDMHFHTSEMLKNRISRSSSRFMRHGSSRTATDLSKACKIHITARTFQSGTELRRTGAMYKISASTRCQIVFTISFVAESTSQGVHQATQTAKSHTNLHFRPHAALTLHRFVQNFTVSIFQIHSKCTAGVFCGSVPN